MSFGEGYHADGSKHIGKIQSPEHVPAYSSHVIVMQALERFPVVYEDPYYTLRRKPLNEDRLTSGANKQSESEEEDSQKKETPHVGRTEQQAAFCFGKNAKKKKEDTKKTDLKSDVTGNLSVASSYDSLESEVDESESKTSSKLKRETKDAKDSEISKRDKNQSGKISESDTSSSESDEGVGKAKETLGWDETSTAKDNIRASNVNGKTSPKTISQDTDPKKSANAVSKSRNPDYVSTPIRVFPGIGSQKRRSTQESDNIQHSERENVFYNNIRRSEGLNKSWENQTQLEKPEGKRKPAKFIAVKPPKSATKVITKRRYHIQIPEEGKKDIWFNAHFNFSDDSNIDWKYDGPVKMKNYYSTSNYT